MTTTISDPSIQAASRSIPLTDRPDDALALPAALLTRAWLLLGIAALGASALFALFLVLARVPGLAFTDADLFRRALTAHVSLSTLVWALAIAGAVWTTHAGRAGAAGWAGAALAGIGALAMLLSPFAGGRAYPANYVPTLDNPVFLVGLTLFGLGIALAGLASLRPGRPSAGPSRLLADASVLAVLAVLAAAVASLWLTSASLPRSSFIEAAAWGPGHALQFAYIVVMLAAWAVLARDGGLLEHGSGMAGERRFIAAVALLAVLPILILPRLYLELPIGQAEARRQFTLLMTWGSWPAATLFASVALWRWRRAGAADGGVARLGLALSMALFALGCGLGMAIRGDTTLVPAHYHGTVGALTVALMGLVYRLGAGLGMTPVPARQAGLQLSLYAGGTALLATGLAWAGWLGAPRKLPAGAVEGMPAWMPAMGLAMAGGALAILAVAMFVWRAGRGLVAIPMGATESRPDVRLRAVLATVAVVAAGGAAVAWLPQLGQVAGDVANEVANEGANEMAVHARTARQAEIRQRFEQGVVMLNEKEFERAMSAFHRVLELAPRLPEAHVNMGFALLGAGRHRAAYDFFESATQLRPGQVNAYYGMAMALEGLGDLDGAIGAMRTYTHLAAKDDPYLRKANAALWEWEARRTPPPAGNPGR